MAAIFQTTYSNAFSWMKMHEFRLRFHWSLFPKGPINKISALVQIMTWRRSGDKPLSEPMMVSLLTHICVTRPQWVNVGLENCLWPERGWNFHFKFWLALILLLAGQMSMKHMMTSSNGNIFRVVGPLWGESTGPLINSPHKIWNTWWRHQMETFFMLLALCEGNPPVPS